jgi:hypothetical protein
MDPVQHTIRENILHTIHFICRESKCFPRNSVSIVLPPYQEKKLSMIWGSHKGEYEDWCLLGCSAV